MEPGSSPDTALMIGGKEVRIDRERPSQLSRRFFDRLKTYDSKKEEYNDA
jgi:hypothetical protein